MEKHKYYVVANRAKWIYNNRVVPATTSHQLPIFWYKKVAEKHLKEHKLEATHTVVAIELREF